MREGDKLKYPFIETFRNMYNPSKSPVYTWEFVAGTADGSDVQFWMETYEKGKLISTTTTGASGSISASDRFTFKIYVVALDEGIYEDIEEFKINVTETWPGKTPDNGYRDESIFPNPTQEAFSDGNDVRDFNIMLPMHFLNQPWPVEGLGGDDSIILPDVKRNYDDWGNRIYGGDGDDTLNARTSSFDFNLYGQGDNDTLLGGDGSDTLDGGTGSDRLDGGKGNDTIIGISIFSEGGETNEITGGPTLSRTFGSEWDTVQYDGERSDYKFSIDSAKSFYLGRATLTISNGANKDVIIGGVEIFEFGGRALYGFNSLQAQAGVLWAIDIVDNIVDLAVKYADKVGPVPQKAKNALYLLDAFREIVSYSFGSYSTMQGGADVFSSVMVGVVKVIRNMVDTALPGSEIFTGETFDLFEQTVRYNARQTYYIIGDENIRPTAKEVALALRDMVYAIKESLPDALVKSATDRDEVIFEVPAVEMGTDGDDVIRLDRAGAAKSTLDVASAETITDSFGYVVHGQAGNDLVDGSRSADQVFGGADNDRLYGRGGEDELNGGPGRDALNGGAQNDRLFGDDGNDILIGGTGADRLYGGSGSDTASYAGAKASITASLTKPSINTGDAKGDRYSSIENLTGSSHADKLTGNTKANSLDGGAGTDILKGLAGNDKLYGGSGNDKLYGGTGADKLYGSAGADLFVFTSTKDSTTSSRDMIYDFSQKQGDRIHLSGIDARSSTSKNDAFTFIGEKAFSEKAGQLRYFHKSGDTFVYGDVDGDGKADFALRIDKTIDLVKGDFIL